MKKPRRKPRPQEHQQANNEPFFKKIQTKIAIGKADDPYEREADAVADKVVSRSGGAAHSNNTSKFPQEAANQITPLAQRSTEEETQAKLQRQEEEEAAQTKLQRQEEEEAAQPKLQMMEEEEAQAKIQREEEEEAAQTKLQRQEEEEAAQPKLQLMEEEEAQTKIQREEEEEAAQTKLQKQEEEEAQAKQTKNQQGVPKVSSKVESSIRNKQGRGQQMDSKTMRRMERGFGADFAHINIHTDATAVEMCKELGAHAFTYGNDIYFNAGKYNPDHLPDQHLLAHELTHTIQQKGRVQKKVQRASFGTGTAPDADYSEVPVAERPRINKALGIIKKIIDNPDKYKTCHEFFKNNNPGNTSLKDVFDRMNVWFDKDNSVWGSSQPPKDIAYSSETWRWGRWSLAGVFVHEMMHLAGQHNEATDDKAIGKCGLPDIDKNNSNR